MKIDKEKFAQAVLIANKEKLTLEEQLKLYVDAMESAEKYNDSSNKVDFFKI